MVAQDAASNTGPNPLFMRALTVTPLQANSAQLEDFDNPKPERGSVLVQAVALGICGTDREIVAGEYGAPPPGHKRLILGHESLGRVVSAPPGSGFTSGDLVVGIVRQPDPVPCPNCAVGEWDMCRNGRYTEHGIKELDGFGAESYRLEPDRLVKVPRELGEHGVLLEPASVVAKAWEQTERIGQRARWKPRRVLITGAGPIGLLAALLARQRELELHVFDRETTGPKPDLVRGLGGRYHSGSLNDLPRDFDVVIECTGAAPVVTGVIELAAADGIVCLAGVSGPGHDLEVDVGLLNRRLVLGNRVIFGSVNANRRHYEAGAAALARADAKWLARLITRRVPLTNWTEALEAKPGDVKTVIAFEPAGRAA